MKQFIKIIAAFFLFNLCLVSLSFGQNMIASNNVPAENRVANIPANTSEETITETNFTSLFPNATAQKWSTSNGNSFVSFLNNGRKASASFDAKGKISYVITHCAMENLPAAFSKTINTDYTAYHLFSASEIKAHGETAYQAVLENATGFITLKYTVDGVEEIQRVKK